MADYISREAAVDKITALINNSGKYTAYESGADDACYIVEHEIPAADVVEQKHGSWQERIVDDDELDKYGFFRRRFYCSACGDWNAHGASKYCPHCGAKMDGGADDDDN